MKKINLRPAGVATSVGETAVIALHDADPDIQVTHNTETEVRGDVDTVNKAESEYQTAKTARLDTAEAQRQASAKAATILTISRELLKPILGSRYSQAWDEVGFVSRTLAVPDSMPKRLRLLKSVELYFGAHPERETAGVATSAMVAAVHTELSDAISAYKKARTQARETKAARDSKMDVLIERLQNLYRELQQFLKPNDPRWIEFGFVVPADISVPQAPGDLAVAPGSTSGQIVPSWGHTANADRFRIYRKIVGVDTDFVRAGSFTGTTADLGGFASGAHVQVYVTAINAAGESQPSETIEVVVP